MSIMILSEIKTEIKAGLGGRTDLDDRMNNIIDLSQLRIARLRDFDELRMIESVTATITSDPEADKVIVFPTLANTRIRKVYSLRRMDNVGQRLTNKLERVLTKNWDKVIPDPEFYDRSWPTHYTIWENNQFELWRVPDLAYEFKIRLSRWPYSVNFTGEGNILDLENMDDLIINLSLSYAFWTLGRTDKAKEFFGIYRGLAKEAIVEDSTDLDQDYAGKKMPELTISKGFDDPFVRSIAGDLIR